MANHSAAQTHRNQAGNRRAIFILAPLVLSMLLGTVPARAADPAQVFVKNCAPCHSKDGKAQTPMARKLGVKDLSLSKLTDEQIVQAIREGRSDKNKPASAMPAFKDKLTQEEIRELVRIVQGFRKQDSR